MDTDQNGSFSSRAEEITHMIIRAGMKQNHARVLVFLYFNSDQTSRDIERGTSLRQPEVSIGINHLMSQGWAQVASQITENKGRPVKLYRLCTTVNAILDDIEIEKKDEFQSQLDLIEKIRRLIHESE
ncbi:MAG: ArsR family transcriptional regulator [Methanospirillum sp.]|uniref:ArsR family transcriptional regulator n=1 Tax=Methanospirillum sp. TaxID=45200 RepID=UPI00236DC1C0|nr:ArsR family transcriptional regulator [Methanospirillum sp.]MDD1727820.1 ArsR family transcriptional regulator [Methanospirillum sp.]